MDLLNREDVEILMQQRGKGPCVSIYMPIHGSGEDVRQNSIRLKNLLSAADEKLASKEVRSPERKRLLEPAMQLVNDSIFWNSQGQGLALFLSPEISRWYRLPLSFNELAVVTDSFHIKQLLSLLSGDGQFYILAVSQKDVRLLQGTRNLVEEVDLSEIIEKFESEFKEDLPEQYLQFHTRTPRKGESRSAIFFGHGGEIDSTIRERLLHYFRFISRELHGMLYEERSPLILACVDFLFPLYREANRYPLLMEEGIKGNPENISAEELHRRAWEIVQPYFQKQQNESIKRYKDQKGTGKTSNNINEILPAAFHGKIDTLFVAVGIQQWGSFDPETSKVTISEETFSGSEDLLDLAAAQTFLNSGTVYAVKPEHMPDSEPLAALFRY